MASAYHPPLLDLIDGEAKPDKHKHICREREILDIERKGFDILDRIFCYGELFIEPSERTSEEIRIAFLYLLIFCKSRCIHRLFKRG